MEKNYDISSTQEFINTEFVCQISDIIDERGVRYSQDGKKLISAPQILDGSYEIKDGVEIICDNAFHKCEEIEGIIFPNSLLAIGNHNFDFSGKLEEIDLPDGLLQIGDYVFGYCSFRELVIPDSVKYIGKESFEYLGALESLKLSDSLTEIKDYSFSNLWRLKEVTLPKKLKKIGNCFLYHCRLLEELEIPDSVEEIGGLYLGDWECLRYLKLSRNLKSIGANPLSWRRPGRKIVFAVCPESESERLGMGVDVVVEENSNFRLLKGSLYSKDFSELIGCSPYVKDLAIPGTVKEINPRAFDGCTEIESVLMPYSLEKCNLSNLFRDRLEELFEFRYAPHYKFRQRPLFFGLAISVPRGLIDKYSYNVFDKGKSTTVNLREINKFESDIYAWEKRLFPCSFVPEDKLSDLFYVDDSGGVYSKDKKILIRVPESFSGFYHIVPGTEIIGQNACYDCVKLAGIELPDSIKEIRTNAFLRCRSLESIELPASLAVVGAGAFEECSSLKRVVINNPDMEVQEHAFLGCKSLKQNLRQ